LRGAGKEFSQSLKKEFSASYAVVSDKNKFQQFIKECRQIINSQNIKVRGIVVH
jgi:ribosomal protein S4E